MPAYNTRSGQLLNRAGAGPPNQPQGSAAEETAVGVAQQTLSVTTSVTGGLGSSVSTMSSTASSVFVQSLKDPAIVMLRAQFKAHHKAMDQKSQEVDSQIINVQKAKDDGMPKEMLRKYSGKLDAVITESEEKLKQFTLVQQELNTQLEYLSMLNEDDPVARQPVEAMQERVKSQFSPFKSRFATKREESRHLRFD